MCERFALTADLSELTGQFQIGKVLFSYKPRYQIVPKQQVAVIVSDGAGKRLESHRWGLIPFWAKDAVNADSELAPQKPAYRRLFAKHRCLIPCSGFYGWKQEGKVRQPVQIGLRHQELFAVAGLYEIWKDPRGKEFRTCTVLTTPTSRMLENYNVRLPAILDDRGIDIWMNPAETDVDLLQAQLRPYHADLLSASPAQLQNDEPEADEEKEGLEWFGKYAMIKK
ncbi:SOS response-associated peptidase [Paenibacillus sp. P26]|nr:SOS response-associated peptidase [Paenibacillus sp. P26]UUZ94968.1 SOS response-associated peptidase [Paenibacillus sp. P25]